MEIYSPSLGNPWAPVFLLEKQKISSAHLTRRQCQVGPQEALDQRLPHPARLVQKGHFTGENGKFLLMQIEKCHETETSKIRNHQNHQTSGKLVRK